MLISGLLTWIYVSSFEYLRQRGANDDAIGDSLVRESTMGVV
jgi:hypothetical protein